MQLKYSIIFVVAALLVSACHGLTCAEYQQVNRSLTWQQDFCETNSGPSYTYESDRIKYKPEYRGHDDRFCERYDLDSILTSIPAPDDLCAFIQCYTGNFFGYVEVTNITIVPSVRIPSFCNVNGLSWRDDGGEPTQQVQLNILCILRTVTTEYYRSTHQPLDIKYQVTINHQGNYCPLRNITVGERYFVSGPNWFDLKDPDPYVIRDPVEPKAFVWIRDEPGLLEKFVAQMNYTDTVGKFGEQVEYSQGLCGARPQPQPCERRVNSAVKVTGTAAFFVAMLTLVLL